MRYLYSVRYYYSLFDLFVAIAKIRFHIPHENNEEIDATPDAVYVHEYVVRTYRQIIGVRTQHHQAIHVYKHGSYSSVTFTRPAIVQSESDKIFEKRSLAVEALG